MNQNHYACFAVAQILGSKFNGIQRAAIVSFNIVDILAQKV